MKLRALAIALVLVAGSIARADNLDEFGFGARAAGMGGAMTGLASDWTATYYNPAGLINSKHVNVGFGFQYADYALDFKSGGGSQVDNQTNRVAALSAFTAGGSSSIPIDEPDRIAFGIGLLFPTRSVTDIDETTPTSQPEWIMYGNHQDRLQILPAVAVKVFDWLYIGGGLTIFAVADGATNITLSSSAVQTEFVLKLKPDIGGLVGVFVQPVDWLSFGLCYRTEREFKLTFNANVSALGIQTPLLIQALDYFTPHQVSVGSAIDLGEYAILALDITYLNYSAFREPFVVASSTTLPVPLNAEASFHDTVIPRIGVEVTPVPWLALRGGYFFRMSPVGSQRNTMFNLVDSDEHVLSLGVGLEYKGPTDPPKEGEKPAFMSNGAIGVDLFFQIHILQGTSVSKSQPGDPIGHYSGGGEIFNMGLSVYGRF